MQQKEESHASEAQTLSTFAASASDEGAAAPSLAIQAKKPWFNFTLCARPSDVYDENMDCSSSSSSEGNLPDDPTVQESFECVFAHQLEEEGISHARHLK